MVWLHSIEQHIMLWHRINVEQGEKAIKFYETTVVSHQLVYAGNKTTALVSKHISR